jgi:hypothetical protein
VRILIEPRGLRYVKDYVNNIWRLMAGNESLTLNRPKYLSGQLWNKVLLNSIFKGSDDEGGFADVKILQNVSNDARTMRLGHAVINTDDADGADNEPISNGGKHKLGYNYAGGPLTYLGDTIDTSSKHHKYKTNVVNSKLSEDKSIKLQHIGYDRYQTTIIRYVEWFVHIQRVMRLLMRDQLSWVNDPIVHKSNVINEHVTEFESGSRFELSDFE